MRGDAGAAAAVLGVLLGVPAETASAATAHFRGRMADPAFMSKAMGLRTAVTSGSDVEISALLGDCFGLDAADQPSALAVLRRRYPAP
jgi:hypothetical protein